MAIVRAAYPDEEGLNSNLTRIATNRVDAGSQDPTTQASITFEGTIPNRIILTGTSFVYDTNRYLVAGTITSIYGVFGGKGVARQELYTDLNLPVQQAIAFGSQNADARSFVFSGNDTLIVDSDAVSGFDGDDTFFILGAGSAGFAGRNTANTIDGGTGFNKAIFPYALRSEAVIGSGGGNENVYQSGITSTLLGIDELRFLDGTSYENNRGSGAQAALEFEGIFGRLPDPINAGGYGKLAEQAGTAAAGRAMLSTPEALALNTRTSDTDFVTRLYRNMLHREGSPADVAGWVGGLDRGSYDRGTLTSVFAATIEAQQVNARSFASASIFAADPNAVEVLRAYEVLLGRVPEAGALGGNVNRLNSGGTDLAQVYRDIQGSGEFKAANNTYGLTVSSSFAAVHSVALSDQVTALITPLVTSDGVAVMR